jgi:tetratricopeptide (TPR) repeat protein
MGGVLRWFVTAVALLSGICALTLGLFSGAAARYEVDFLPDLVLLAVIGILSLERALAPTSESGQADRPVWRRALRWGWGLLLGFSLAFNLLACVERRAEAQDSLGRVLLSQARVPDAIARFEQALRINPDLAEAHSDLGAALAQTGRIKEAIAHFEQALRINSNLAEAHYNLGNALAQVGRVPEAIAQYEQALRINPDDAEARNALARLQARQ